MAVWILLGIAMGSAVLTAAGLLLSRDLYERLHYMSPVASIGAAAIAAAIVVRESISAASLKAVFAALIIFVMNPVLTHATARAARIHKHGKWQPRPEEHIREEEP